MSGKKNTLHTLFIVSALTIAGCSSSSSDSPLDTADDLESVADTDVDAGAPPDTIADGDTPASGPDTTETMTFFLTSEGPGDGGNLGGLPGADAHCANLAEAAGGLPGQQWRAYLSTTGADGINAVERIGAGPWTNANGVIVATDPENLLSEESNITLETAVTQTGEQVNGIGMSPLRHDILTGTELNGMASTSTADTTCGNWTSNDLGNATVGHHDRVGGGSNPTSFSSAHPSSGCSQDDLQATGGDGLFYCFVQN